MDMNPQRVRTAEFRTVKKGLDPTEVQAFLNAVADELERAQNQSTAMEARARAAVARLQELSDGASSQSDASAEILRPAAAAVEQAPVTASVDQSETISRTLLLAQRTADTTIAEARAEAERLRVEAEAEASQQVGSSREIAESLLSEARNEARKVGEAERKLMEGEVNSLLARRDFLESDVDHLETFLVDQRTRLRDAANQIVELTERVPGGLGSVRRPLLSASDDGVAGARTDGAADVGARDFGATRDLADTDRPDASGTARVEIDNGDNGDDGDLWLPDASDDLGPVIDADGPANSSF